MAARFRKLSLISPSFSRASTAATPMRSCLHLAVPTPLLKPPQFPSTRTFHNITNTNFHPTNTYQATIPNPYHILQQSLNLQPNQQQVRGMAKAGKTNKSAAKRFIVMANGRLKRGRAGRSHNTGHTRKRRKNNLARTCGVENKKDRHRILHMLGIRK